MGHEKALVDLDRLPQLFDGFVITPRIKVNFAQVGVDDQRKWIQFLSALHLCQSLIKLAHNRQILPGVPVVSVCIVGIELDGSFKF